jgi:hypothetical protein
VHRVVDVDLRRDLPTDAYEGLRFEVPVEEGGEARARFMVRALGWVEAWRWPCTIGSRRTIAGDISRVKIIEQTDMRSDLL